MPIFGEDVELALETRNRRQIKNYLTSRPVIDGTRLACDNYKREYADCLHRSTFASARYNCHGLTFAARRTEIIDSDAIQWILKDDGYTEIDSDRVEIGDIIIYYDGGDFSHSGVVVRVEPIGQARVPWILSKWGRAHEVIHKHTRCPYWGGPDVSCRYWRICE